uniref:Uncharacterized protein n=1 Tax=Arundo donax TaxID=35708 RepID=A0A0A8YLB3_ARUDO
MTLFLKYCFFNLTYLVVLYHFNRSFEVDRSETISGDGDSIGDYDGDESDSEEDEDRRTLLLVIRHPKTFHMIVSEVTTQQITAPIDHLLLLILIQ